MQPSSPEPQKSRTGAKGEASLGRRLLPASWHERLLLERWPIHDFLRRAALPLLAPGVEVLDAGSGRLPEQHLRDEILATGAELTTLDLFPGPGVNEVGDVAAMPFEDDSFDMVLCTQVLEHVRDPGAVCAELHRILRPGGHALVTAPQSAWLHNLPYHYFHFTRIGLAMLLEAAGFEIVEVSPQGGHFVNLAMQLHYTVRLFEERRSRSAFDRVVWLPLALLWRLAFGLLFKVAALGLDRALPHPGNTQGWNFLVRK